jgi:hypothetical protein
VTLVGVVAPKLGGELFLTVADEEVEWLSELITILIITRESWVLVMMRDGTTAYSFDPADRG